MYDSAINTYLLTAIFIMSYINKAVIRNTSYEMPCLRILTNIPHSKIPKDFVNKVNPVLAKVLRKDVSKFLCVISGDCQLSFNGDSSQPGAVSTLESIGHVEPEDNKIIGKELADFVHKELGIHPDRFFISIYDLKGSNIVRNGNTIG